MFEVHESYYQRAEFDAMLEEIERLKHRLADLERRESETVEHASLLYTPRSPVMVDDLPLPRSAFDTREQ